MLRMIRTVLLVVALAAVAIPAAAQQPVSPAPPDSIVQLFLSKGYLTAEEAADIRQAGTPAEANERLLRFFLSKGLISQDEYNTAVATSAVSASENGTSGARLMNAAVTPSPTPAAAAASPAPAPKSAAWPV